MNENPILEHIISAMNIYHKKNGGTNGFIKYIIEDTLLQAIKFAEQAQPGKPNALHSERLDLVDYILGADVMSSYRRTET